MIDLILDYKIFTCPEMSIKMLDRIRDEYLFCRNNPRDHIGVGMIGTDLTRWRATIVGPEGSPYEGGLFFLRVDFPNTYPSEPPLFTFETPIYHPNVSIVGEICLSIFKTEKWNPQMSVSTILVYIIGLMANPTSYNPMRLALGNELKDNPQEFNRKARESTQQHAM